jgi:hypothetical protein
MPVQNTNAILSNNISEELDQYIQIRSGVHHYLQITDNETQLFNSNGPLESKPNLVFYTEGADTKVMLDYSNASDKDKKYLQILFKNFNDFSGLTFSNAAYLDEKNNIDTTFNLDLYFRQFKDNILFAKTTTSISSNYLQKVFEGDYFISTPTISYTENWSNITNTTNSLLVSVNPKSTNNLYGGYLQAGDLIEIINPNSLNNNKRYEILQTDTVNNKQVIKFKTKAVNESLIGSPTIINVYAKTKRKERSSSTLNQKVVGCCYSYTEKKYYPDATEYECDVRTNGQYEFFAAKCTEYNGQQVPLPMITFNSKVIETRRLKYVLFDNTELVELYISYANNKIYVNNTEYDYYSLSRGKIYKITQDDESNLGLPIRIAKNTSATTRQDINYYYDNVSGTTNPEGIGSEIYFKVTENTVDLLYLLTENDLTITPLSLVVV